MNKRPAFGTPATAGQRERMREDTGDADARPPAPAALSPEGASVARADMPDSAKSGPWLCPPPRIAPHISPRIPPLWESVHFTGSLKTSSGTPLCSVVIPTYLRPDALRNCLVALLNQSLAPEFYEILVVDDARSEALRVKVLALAEQHGLGGPLLRYLRPAEGAKGPAAARNAGWRAANGEIIAFTDDDTIPAPRWLEQGLAAMAADDVAAAWGRVVVPLPRPPILPTDSERNTAQLDNAEFVTANCFVRRTALTDAGGFDEHFTRAWREDSDLYFTLLERHAKVVCAPAAKVLHPPRSASPGASLQVHRNLYFDALLYKKHPQLYRQKIAAGPPWHYYATVLCALTAVAAALGGQGELAALAGLGWSGLTAQFAGRRLRGASKAWPHVADMIATSIAIPFLAVFWRLYGALHFRVPFV